MKHVALLANSTGPSRRVARIASSDIFWFTVIISTIIILNIILMCLLLAMIFWLIASSDILDQNGGSNDISARWILSGGTNCLMRPRLLYALFVVVKDRHSLLQYSQLLQNTCVRHVVLDKCFPVNFGSLGTCPCANAARATHPADVGSASAQTSSVVYIYIYMYIHIS